MPALSDPKLEKFAQALLVNYANDMPRTKAAEDAARKAGYSGSALGPNARKRAQRKDVKARMAELAAPALAKIQDELITPTVDLAVSRLMKIAMADLGVDAIKVPDQLAAWKLMGEWKGWKAPDKIAQDGPMEMIIRWDDTKS